MSKRQLCHQCQLPAARCLCAYIRPTANAIKLFILQHPSEVGHAKNTVPILMQSLSQVECVLGETEADFAELRAQLAQYQKVFVLYPTETSQAVDAKLIAEVDLDKVALLVIDGTWRKALKMLKLNPWLTEYPLVHLPENLQGQYAIRQAKRTDSFSTLEAATYALKCLQLEFKSEHLLAAFLQMNQNFISNLPKDIQQRYVK